MKPGSKPRSAYVEFETTCENIKSIKPSVGAFKHEYVCDRTECINHPWQEAVGMQLSIYSLNYWARYWL